MTQSISHHPTSPYLTSQEVDELCAPLTQGAAQKRFIENVLGIPVVGRRPDGLPIVGRAAAEARLSAAKEVRSAANGFKWSK